MKSIRSYLAVVLVATICIVNFIAALNGYLGSSVSARQLLESRLQNMAQTILSLSKDNPSLTSSAFSQDSIFQVWSADRLLNQSENAGKTALVESQAGLHIVNYNGVQWQTFVIHDDASELWVVYGEPNDQYQKLIDELAVRSILPIIWVLPIIAILVWFITGFGLSPLRELRASLSNRSERDLSEIDVERYPQEMSHVVSAMNSLFSRLEEALGRERQFAANAAHELRTPLAVLKINLHNHLRWLGENVEDEIQRDGMEQEQLLFSVKRMEKSIEQILALHQLTPENFKRTIAPCNLKRLLQAVILDLYGSLREKSLDVELVGDSLSIPADQNALYTLFTNILENCKKYTPAGGQIKITLSYTDSLACVRIEDSGPGIAPENYGRVFERFYRGEQSDNTQNVPGAGIGLSIVKSVLELHNGDIVLAKSSELGGLCASIFLPTSQYTQQLGESHEH